MNGKCALYRSREELRKSHIIPKFAFDYLKKTGGKYMRKYGSPNKRVQDGPKRYLLGERAESDFSRRERWFANNIFFPYMKDRQQSFEYDENMPYFLVSVLWRVLLDQLEHASIKNEKRLDFLTEVAEDWRQYLLNGIIPSKFDEINIFLTDRIQHHNGDRVNADLYLSRVIDATIVTNSDCSHVAVYFKFLRFIVWSVVKGPVSDGENIKIRFEPGKLITPQKLQDNFMGGFLHHRIQEIDKMPSANPKQEKLIIEEMIKNEESFWESDAGQSMLNDVRLRK